MPRSGGRAGGEAGVARAVWPPDRGREHTLRRIEPATWQCPSPIYALKVLYISYEFQNAPLEQTNKPQLSQE